jgi:hypothetical protein
MAQIEVYRKSPISLRVALDRRSPRPQSGQYFVYVGMVKFLLWLILFVVCWPLALLALLLYPILWLVLLPFRLVGIVVDGVFDTLRAIVRLPARALGSARP